MGAVRLAGNPNLTSPILNFLEHPETHPKPLFSQGFPSSTTPQPKTHIPPKTTHTIDTGHRPPRVTPAPSSLKPQCGPNPTRGAPASRRQCSASCRPPSARERRRPALRHPHMRPRVSTNTGTPPPLQTGNRSPACSRGVERSDTPGQPPRHTNRPGTRRGPSLPPRALSQTCGTRRSPPREKHPLPIP